MNMICRFGFAVSLLLAGVPASALAQSPCGETVTVQAGDTLGRIAARCATTVAEILEANPDLDSPDRISIGMTLRLPVAEAVSEDEPGVRDLPAEPAVQAPSPPASDPPQAEEEVTEEVSPADEAPAVSEAPPEPPVVEMPEIPLRDETPALTEEPAETPAAEAPAVAEEPAETPAVEVPVEPEPPAAEPPPPPATVTIEPTSGPPRASVKLFASGFPPDTELFIGAGTEREVYDIITSAYSDAAGELSGEVILPGYANYGEQWLFVVVTEDRAVEASSEAFTVRRAEQGGQ